MTKKDKKYHHGDLKRALVDAGIALLEEKGLDKLSLRGIAARVGVSHTAPKNHFGSLKGLLTAIAAEGFRRHAAFQREGLIGSASRRDRLHAAMRGYVRFARAHPALFELMFSPLYCDFGDETLRETAAGSYAILSEISDGLDWDKAGTPNAQLKTETMLWSLAHGYALLMLGHQLQDGVGRDIGFDILEILPDFDYLPDGPQPNSETPCA